MGGVINIVTKGLQEDSDGGVGTRLNSNSGYGVDGYYRGSAGPVQYSFYGSRDEADGFQPFRDRDFQRESADLLPSERAPDWTPDAGTVAKLKGNGAFIRELLLATRIDRCEVECRVKLASRVPWPP